MKRRLFLVLLSAIIAAQAIIPAIAEENDYEGVLIESSGELQDDLEITEGLAETPQEQADKDSELEESVEVQPTGNDGEELDAGIIEEEPGEEDLYGSEAIEATEAAEAIEATEATEAIEVTEATENTEDIENTENSEDEIVVNETEPVESELDVEVEIEEETGEFAEDYLEADPGDLMSNPVIISFNQIYSKTWGRYTDHLNHYCKINIPQRGILTINATKPFDDDSEYARLYFTLYNSEGEPIWGNDTYKEVDTASDTYSLKVGLDTGTYYLTLKPGFYVTSGLITTYYSMTFSPTAYCEVEPNESISLATPVTFGNAYTGYFGSAGSDYEENDFWSFNCTAGTTYKIAINNLNKIISSSIIIYLIDPAGNSDYIKTDLEYKADENGFNYILYTAQTSGRHYLKFWNWNGVQIPYAVRIDNPSGGGGNSGGGNQETEAPTKYSNAKLKLIAAYNGAHGVGVKWIKLSGATEYTIWQKYQGVWRSIKTVKPNDSSLQVSGNTLMYTDQTVKTGYGKGYIYSVSAKIGNAYVDYDRAGVAIYRLNPPTLKSAKNNKAGTATVTWKSVFGRTETNGAYDLQFATEADAKAGRWTNARRLPGFGHNVTSTTITGLKKGTKYVFRIRCSKTNKDRGTFYSEYSPWMSVNIKK